MTTMVDSKIGKTFQRSVGRAKEKLLQNLGKVDRTADEILDEQVGNFNKQQGAATRLQKELNNYIRCIRACAAASRSLLESVGEVYEPEWGGKELLSINAQSVELLWNDFAHRLAEQVLIPLNTYQGQFPEMRKKIEKRSRKLIDFDGERHALQALQANPRRAEAKLGKQREALESAKRTYEVLNAELHEELPSLYNSRIVFLVSAMSTLFASENIFHTETSKVYTELEGVVERLSKESAKGALNFKMPSNAIMNHSGSNTADEKGENGSSTSSSPVQSNVNSNPSSPVSQSRPTSLNLSPSTPNGDQHTAITPNNNKTVAETEAFPSVPAITTQNNQVMSKGTTPTTDASNKHIPSQTENGGACKDAKTNETKIVNGTRSGSEGESSPIPIMEQEMKKHEETGKLMTTQDGTDNDKAKLVGENIDNTTTAKDSKNDSQFDNVVMDCNNNDVKTEDDGGSVGKEVVEIGDNKTSGDPPTAIPPSRGVVNNKPMHGILSHSKHANGEESLTKDDNNEPGVLYKVRATYRYQKEDVDELSFESGEIIRVIEYDEPEEQEEGWLMGMKENGEKGLFPANFTRPI